MPTTGANFVYTTFTNPVLNGAAVVSSPLLAAFGPKEAMSISQSDQVLGGSGAANPSGSVVVDRLTFDPSYLVTPAVGTPHAIPEIYGTYLTNYAKNGAVLLALSGTTPQTVSLINTATNTPQATAGDTVFATVYVIRVKNLGTGAVTLAPGASNPSPIPAFTGTTPTVSIPAGGDFLVSLPAGGAITSSATNLTFTPAATTNLAITIGGA